MSRPAWFQTANCSNVDPNLFYPNFVEGSPKSDAAIDEAKQVCKNCPVKQLCLTYALTNREQFGVWGGMTEKERRSYLRRLASKRKKELEKQ